MSNYLSIIFFFICSTCLGQQPLFRDISEFDSLSTRFKLLYFHFDGCAPCKKMDDQVFTDTALQHTLRAQYDLYSIYNFGPLEKQVRAKYKSKTNPGFVVLNASNKELHHFSGFYETGDFIVEVTKAHSIDALSQLEMRYPSEHQDFQFLRQYIKAKESASQLDTALILTYMERLDLDPPFGKETLMDVLYYGYYRGDEYFDCTSKYFEYLKRVYASEAFPDLSKIIANRMIFNLSTCYYHASDSAQKMRYLDEMELLEHGDFIGINVLSDPGRLYSMITDIYPSFKLRNKLLAPGDSLGCQQLFDRYYPRMKGSYLALHQTANDILDGELALPKALAEDLIIASLTYTRTYFNTATYAEILFEKGDYPEAERVAEEAIVLTEKMVEKAPKLEALLKEIRAAMRKDSGE